MTKTCVDWVSGSVHGFPHLGQIPEREEASSAGLFTISEFSSAAQLQIIIFFFFATAISAITRFGGAITFISTYVTRAITSFSHVVTTVTDPTAPVAATPLR